MVSQPPTKWYFANILCVCSPEIYEVVCSVSENKGIPPWQHRRCVCVVILWSIMYVKLVDAPEEGHTGFLHLPSAMLASIFISRMIQPSFYCSNLFRQKRQIDWRMVLMFFVSANIPKENSRHTIGFWGVCMGSQHFQQSVDRPGMVVADPA